MGIDAGYIPIQSMLTIGVLTDFLGILLDWKRLTIDLLPPHSSRMLWTFPTYSMPDIAFFTFILNGVVPRKGTRVWDTRCRRNSWTRWVFPP